VKIVIPSKGRAGVLQEKALRLFPDAVVCVGDDEVDAYSRVSSNLLVHPAGVVGIGPLRQWVMDHVNDPVVVMVDDDVTHVYSQVGFHKRRIEDADTARAIVERLSVGEDVSSAIYKLVSIVELKSADMPLDVASLATAVCDVGFFRMVVMPAEFRHLPGKVSKFLGTRGQQYLPGPDRMSLDYLVESCVTDRSAAIRWLREQLVTSAGEVCHV
jgi:hypothetical protein